MDWYWWVVAGIVLMILEIAAFGDFFIFFFGTGSVLTGLLVLSFEHWSTPLTAAYQWSFFAVNSILLLISFRRRLIKFISVKNESEIRDISGYTDKLATVIEKDIEPLGRGIVSLGQTRWNAKNVGKGTLATNDEVEVQGRDGLTLLVDKITSDNHPGEFSET